MESTRSFLRNGADSSKRCDWDITPFTAAVQKASLGTLFMMLEHDADSRKGQLIHYILERKALDQLALIDLLVAYGSPTTLCMFEDDPPGWMENKLMGAGTPLHRAAQHGFTNLVSYFLDHGAKNDLRDSWNRSPSALAKDKGHDLVAELIESRSRPTGS